MVKKIVMDKDLQINSRSKVHEFKNSFLTLLKFHVFDIVLMFFARFFGQRVLTKLRAFKTGTMMPCPNGLLFQTKYFYIPFYFNIQIMQQQSFRPNGVPYHLGQKIRP